MQVKLGPLFHGNNEKSEFSHERRCDLCGSGQWMKGPLARRRDSLGLSANDVFVTTARTSQDQVSTCSASRSSCPLPLPTVITEDNQIIGGGTRGTSTRSGKIWGLSSRYNEGQLDQSLSSQRSVSVLQGQTKTFIYEGNPPIPSIIC